MVYLRRIKLFYVMGGYRRRKKGSGSKPMFEDEDKLVKVVQGLLINNIPKKQFASILGVSPSTWYNWMGTYPKLRKLMAENQAVIHAKITASLIERATGFAQPDAVKMFFDKTTGTVVTEKYTEYYPPDVNAIKYYLNNKMPDVWKERTTVDNNTSTNVTHNISWEETPGCDPLKPMEDPDLPTDNPPTDDANSF